MIRLTLILLLGLAATAQGTQRSLEGGGGTTANTRDTFTIAGTSITCTDYIVDITADTDVYIDGQGDTVIFNSDNNAGTNNGEYAYWGIEVRSSKNVTCSGLVIIQYSPNARYNCGIRLTQNPLNTRLIDCEIHMKGAMSRGIDCWGASSRSYISGGNYSSFVDSFLSRGGNQASAMQIDGSPESTGVGGYYTAWVRKIRIDSVPHTGLTFNNGVFRIDSCYLKGDAHNDMYSYPSGALYSSADNPYLIGMGDWEAGSYVRGCTLLSGTNWEGCRGIISEGANGTALNPIRVVGNYMNLHQGHSDYEGAVPGCWVMRVRPNSDHGDPTRYLQIDSNVFISQTDTIEATTYIGEQAAGVYFSDAGEFSNGDSSGTGSRILRNRIIVNTDSTNWADEYDTYGALIIECGVGDSMRHYSQENYIESNGTPFKLAWGNGGGTGWWSIRDTIKWLSPRFAMSGQGRSGAYYVGGGGTSVDNFVDDPVFIDTTTGDSVDFQNYSDGYEMFFNATMQITVNDTDANPISDAIVWMIDQFSDTTWDTTGANGVASKLVRYDYRSSLNNTRTDSTYGPQTIGAAKTGDTVTATTLIWWNNKDTTLTLTATGGEPDPPAAGNHRRKGGKPIGVYLK